MLQPKRIKYRKAHRGHRRGPANAGNAVSFGEFGLQAMGCSWMPARQIEAARRAITHHIRRGGKVWIRVFPDKPVSKKPAETRQGGGEGAVVGRAGMLCEIAGVKEDVGKEAMKLASHKLPIPTRVVARESGV